MFVVKNKGCRKGFSFSEDPVKQIKSVLETKTTKAPTIHNEASILGAMETASKQVDDDELRQAMKDCGLGTPATRAQILERLIQVQYIIREKNKLIPTDKGIYLIDSIQEKELLSPELTGEWEQKLNQIAKNTYQRETFMKEIKEFISKVVKKVQISMPDTLEKCPLCEHDMTEKQKFYMVISDFVVIYNAFVKFKVC
jgi:DNA topoisomerase-3